MTTESVLPDSVQAYQREQTFTKVCGKCSIANHKGKRAVITWSAECWECHAHTPNMGYLFKVPL